MALRPGRGRVPARAIAVCAAVLAGGPPSPGAEPAARRELDELSARERVELLRGARIWRPVATETLDLLAGPAVRGAQPFDASVACDWVKPEDPPGGFTPKFYCDLGGNDVVKVKFGKDNGEVYAEVAATRLMWALGFGADNMYPVQVTCRGCPIEPWYFPTERRVPEKRFEMATIERKLDAKKIATKDFEGWSWDEIDRVDESSGGAPRAHRDALKLLAALMQHSDNKPAQQRMVCPRESLSTDAAGNESCAQALLYLQDVGATFGISTFMNTSRVDLQKWSSVPVWKDPATCTAHLANSWSGNLTHPRISEAGRHFLAGRLALLSDRQLRDLFTAARLDRRGATVGEGSAARPETVEDWVSAFRKKREEIAGHRCPE